MIVIETEKQLQLFISQLRTDNCIFDIILSDEKKHALNNSVSLLLVKFLFTGEFWCLSVSHNEGIPFPGAWETVKNSLRNSIAEKYVLDKKKIIEVLEEDNNFIDLNIVKYLEEGTHETFEDVSNNSKKFIEFNFARFSDLNRVIPIYKHADLFKQKLEKVGKIENKKFSDKSFEFMNSIATNNFSKLETIGLAIDEEKFYLQFGEEQKINVKNKKVFSQYNLFTSTGRPSNRFGNINFAAMNKTDGSREPFISRHGNDGMLMMVDYTAFHPRLIANLVNYPLNFEVDIYKYLAQSFFKKPDVSVTEVSLAKGFTFQQVYGGIQDKYLHIPYFKKVQEYIAHRWDFFVNNEYIETPIYYRKIKLCHIDNPTPNKLFNYILQAYETEVAVQSLGRILNYLKDKKTQPILYTYDSILFDIHKDDGIKTIREIKKIMVDDRFPVKIYVGKNYANMSKIEVV